MDQRRRLKGGRRAGLVLTLLLTVACQRTPEAPTPMDLESRFVAATVALSCLGRSAPSPQALAVESRGIYARYGFAEPMEYLALIAAFEASPAVRARISQGEASCPDR